MEGEEYTESELKSEEESAEMLQTDEEFRAEAEKGLQAAADYAAEGSGLLAAEQDREAVPAEESGGAGTSPLQQARAAYTGITGEPQNITAASDTMQQIQQMAHFLTNAVVGATLTVDFAEGESVTVEIKRSGALNTIAVAHLTTESTDVAVGRDFSPVDMDVVFPIGIDTRKIDIPIRRDYIAGSADFKLKLTESEMCTVTSNEATVTIEGARYGGQRYIAFRNRGKRKRKRYNSRKSDQSGNSRGWTLGSFRSRRR